MYPKSRTHLHVVFTAKVVTIKYWNEKGVSTENFSRRGKSGGNVFRYHDKKANETHVAMCLQHLQQGTYRKYSLKKMNLQFENQRNSIS